MYALARRRHRQHRKINFLAFWSDKHCITYPVPGEGAWDCVHCSPIQVHGTKPFRSRANSLPGANRPIGLWPIRSLANSLPGPFVPWPFRSLELSLRGPFAPDGQNHYLLGKNSYKEIKVT